TLDVPNVQSLQLLVVRGSEVQNEQEDTSHRIEVPDNRALTFRQVNTARDNSYIITKTYVTDPTRNSVLIDVAFKSRGSSDCGCDIYVYYDPSLNKSGMHDEARSAGGWLVAA